MSNKLVKDFRKYQNFVFQKLTARQLICLVVGVIILFILLMCKVPSDTFWIVAVFLALIAVAIGWIRPYGVTIEKYLLSILKQGTGNVRYNRSCCIIDATPESIPKQINKDKSKQLKKTN